MEPRELRSRRRAIGRGYDIHSYCPTWCEKEIGLLSYSREPRSDGTPFWQFPDTPELDAPSGFAQSIITPLWSGRWNRRRSQILLGNPHHLGRDLINKMVLVLAVDLLSPLIHQASAFAEMNNMHLENAPAE